MVIGSWSSEGILQLMSVCRPPFKEAREQSRVMDSAINYTVVGATYTVAVLVGFCPYKTDARS